MFFLGEFREEYKVRHIAIYLFTYANQASLWHNLICQCRCRQRFSFKRERTVGVSIVVVSVVKEDDAMLKKALRGSPKGEYGCNHAHRHLQVFYESLAMLDRDLACAEEPP